jgi:hypothetical protein
VVVFAFEWSSASSTDHALGMNLGFRPGGGPRMTTDTFLFNAGSLFFAAWIAVIAAVTVAAFGRDLLPGNAHARPEPAQEPKPADRLRPTQSSTR